MPGTPSSGGRNALGASIHALRGTTRADRHGGHDTPEPPVGRPEPPWPLDGKAAEEWDRIIGLLELSGVIAITDGPMVYQHCRLVAETEALSDKQAEAEAAAQRLEESIPDVEASDRMALFLEIGKMRHLAAGYDNKIRQGRQVIRQYLVEFGLGPIARQRVKIPKAKPESKLERLRQLA